MIIEEINLTLVWTFEQANMINIWNPGNDKPASQGNSRFMQHNQKVLEHVQVKLIVLVHPAVGIILFHLSVHLFRDFDQNAVD